MMPSAKCPTSGAFTSYTTYSQYALFTVCKTPSNQASTAVCALVWERGTISNVTNLPGILIVLELASQMRYVTAGMSHLVLQLVGGPERWNPFMKAYISKFRFGTVNSLQFKAFFLEFFADVPKASEVDWQTWYYGRGEGLICSNPVTTGSTLSWFC